MLNWLKKAFGPGAPQRTAFPVRRLRLALLVFSCLNLAPCAALRATDTGSTIPVALLQRPTGGPKRVGFFKKVSDAACRVAFAGGSALGVALLLQILRFKLDLRTTGEARDRTVETSEAKRKRLEVEAILAARAPPSSADRLN
eukprot:scaffold4608_cov129-Isochrysis_galbana.AAC.6